MKLLIFIVLFTTYSLQTEAHSGRTNSSGCHMNHKTGDYHCHRADEKQLSSRAPASVKEELNRVEKTKKKKADVQKDILMEEDF